MFRPVWYLINLVALSVWYSAKAIGAGLLRVPQRQGGVYDECARRWARKLLRAAGARLRTVGMEHVPLDRPVVYVSNHQSFFDILACAAVLPGTLRFVAKKEMAKIPILGGAMRAAGQIFIDRQNREKAFVAYEEAAQAVRAGMNAVIFAEGTRSRTGKLLPFKKGAFVFAIASQVPVVPMYCAGTFRALPKGSIWVRPGPIALHFAEPIETVGMTYDDREQLTRRTRAVIERLRIDAGEDER